MKILTLEFSNLNSLYGQWRIDFSSPAYVNDGIFAITGPTGAGKSTILDAICLALYGRTPRLDSVGSQSNEIMSRQRASCYASVTFETRNGTFRCTWEQHKARKEVEGNLQDASHELIDLSKATILSNKKREVAQAVEQHTGMNFERFTRSMLLAQGDFDAFLHADADQRAPILEQITGTEIYSDISRKVHSERRDLADQLDRMRDDAKAYEPLDAHTVDSLHQQEALLSRWEAGIERRLNAAVATEAVLQHLQYLEHATQRIGETRKQLDLEERQLQEIRSKYLRASAALEIESIYQSMCAMRSSTHNEQVALDVGRKELEEVTQLVDSAERNMARVRKEKEDAQQRWRQAEPAIREAQRMLVEKKHLDTITDDLRRQLCKRRRTRRSLIVDMELLQASTEELERSIASDDSWIRIHVGDGEAGPLLQALRLKMGSLDGLHQQVAQEEHALGTAHKALIVLEQEKRDNQTQLESSKEEERILVEAVEAGKKRLDELLDGKSLGELKRELEHLREKELLLASIETLEQQRDRLIDGQPCPLCGSVHHPYSEGALPSRTENTERLEALKDLLDELESLQSDLVSHNELLSRHQHAMGILQANNASFATRISDAQTHLCEVEARLATANGKIEQSYQEICSALESKIGRRSVRETVEEDLRELEARLTSFGLVQTRLEDNRQQLAHQHEKLVRLENSRNEISMDVGDVRSRLADHRNKTENIRQNLDTLLEDRDLKLWEQELRETLRTTEEAGNAAQETLSHLQQRVSVLSHSIEVGNTRLQKESESLQTLETSFRTQMKYHGFEDEHTFLEARSTLEQRQLWKERIEAFTVRKAEFLSEEKRIADELADARSKRPARWNPQLLSEEIEDAKRETTRLAQRKGALFERLAGDSEKRMVHAGKMDAVERHKELFTHYDRLNTLIGSHDGKKFRNFAQGLTFELLLSHANRHLETLTGRYLLSPDPGKPLEIAVVDLYQAGQVRSAKNLSGGESFLVSLALSLGLSSIASRKVQVDSLFLDEGFGTLDEQTLETALDALGALRNQGKLVGIISHVGALQERIPVRISVVPLTGGMSRLEGPGCLRLS